MLRRRADILKGIFDVVDPRLFDHEHIEIFLIVYEPLATLP